MTLGSPWVSPSWAAQFDVSRATSGDGHFTCGFYSPHGKPRIIYLMRRKRCELMPSPICFDDHYWQWCVAQASFGSFALLRGAGAALLDVPTHTRTHARTHARIRNVWGRSVGLRGCRVGRCWERGAHASFGLSVLAACVRLNAVANECACVNVRCFENVLLKIATFST